MQTLSKNKISQLASLQQKKYREEFREFLVEGKKSVEEFIHSEYKLLALIVDENVDFELNKVKSDLIYYSSNKDRARITSLSTAPDVMAVFEIPAEKKIKWEDTFSLVLDGVRDPGNLGTIIRTADWFGIKNILCSNDTVECYNPKVVQATMGSLARVNVQYADLPALLSLATEIKDFSVLGAYMNGKDVKEISFNGQGFLVMGNESEGIRKDVEPFVTQKISIAKSSSSNAESLNVSIATAILCHSLTK